jgi:hypothetical protein
VYIHASAAAIRAITMATSTRVVVVMCKTLQESARDDRKTSTGETDGLRIAVELKIHFDQTLSRSDVSKLAIS